MGDWPDRFDGILTAPRDDRDVPEDRPGITLACLADEPSAETVYHGWAARRPGFDVLVLRWPDDSPSGHERLVATLAALPGPYAVFCHGFAARSVPALVAPGGHAPPTHVFLHTTLPPQWSAAPAGSAAVPLTVLTASTTTLPGWRESWDGDLYVRVFDAGADFLTTRAADVVFLIEDELLVLRPTMPEAPPARTGSPE